MGWLGQGWGAQDRDGMARTGVGWLGQGLGR